MWLKSPLLKRRPGLLQEHMIEIPLDSPGTSRSTATGEYTGELAEIIYLVKKHRQVEHRKEKCFLAPIELHKDHIELHKEWSLIPNELTSI